MSEEKNIRVVQLLNPDIRPEDVTNQTIQLLNQDIRPEHVTNQTQHMNQGVLNQVYIYYIIINNFICGENVIASYSE